MKRWELYLGFLGLALLALGALWSRRGEPPRADFILQAGNCQLPVTHFSAMSSDAPAGSVVIIHGLAASRKIMFYLGEDFAGHGIQAYLLDLPGHGDSTDAFSYARAEDCARAAVETLIAQKQIDPAKTILLGHSMGGEIAIRMADRLPLPATIAISPAPMVMSRRMPANLLVFSAQFDVWALKRQAAALQQAAGGDRSAPDDFVQNRAFELVHVPLATHTSMLDDRAVVHRAELWAMQTLFPSADAKTLTLNLDLGTYEAFAPARRRLAGGILGLIGIGLILPLAISLAAIAGGAVRNEKFDPAANTVNAPARRLVLAEVAVASLGAVLFMVVVIPLRFLHIYAGDYLLSVLVIAAAALLLLNRQAISTTLKGSTRGTIAAIALAFLAMLGIGAWFNWHTADLWLNAPRWTRFTEILPLTFALCFAEETALGPLGTGKSSATRFFTSLAMRTEVWLACVLAFFVLGSGQLLLPILVMQFAVFSIAQRLGSDALLRRSGSPMAAAVFGAILAAWFVAAVFPIT
jgi:alpha-beta hydrolase superfamily lysophospholipase